MSTYRAGGMKPPGLTSNSDPFDQVVADVIANDQPQLLPAKFGMLLDEQHLVHPSIHGSLWASLCRWMGDSLGALISNKIIYWNKDGAAPTSAEYSDFAEQLKSKPGDKFDKMLDDVNHLHRMIARTAESKIKEKEILASSKLAKLISELDSSLRRSSWRSRRNALSYGHRPRAWMETAQMRRPRSQASSSGTLQLSF